MIRDGKTGKFQPHFEPKTLFCCDCGQTFIWSVGEQQFYFSKSLSAPKRCPSCRERRRKTLIPDETTFSGWEVVDGD